MAADCRARCVDGADLGSPVPGTDHIIAHVDPRCPVHGDDPLVVQDYIAALEAVTRAARPIVADRSLIGDPAVMALRDALAELERMS